MHDQLLITVGGLLIVLVAIALALFHYYARKMLYELSQIAHPPKLPKRHKGKRKHKAHETTVSQLGTKSDQYKRAARPILSAKFSGMDQFPSQLPPIIRADDTGGQILTTKTAGQRMEEEDAATQSKLDKWMPGVKRGK